MLLVPPVREAESTQSVSMAWSLDVAGAAAHAWWRTSNLGGWDHVLSTLTTKLVDSPLSAHDMKVLIHGPRSKDPPARTKQELLRSQVDVANTKSGFMVSGASMGLEDDSMSQPLLLGAGNVQGRFSISDIEPEAENGSEDHVDPPLSALWLDPWDDTPPQSATWKEYFNIPVDSQVSTRTDTGGCFGGSFGRFFPQITLMSRLRAKFRNLKQISLKFLDDKGLEMSKDTTPAVFCQNSLEHEATSDTSSPYPSSPTNCCFIGTYPVDGPLVRDGRERGRARGRGRGEGERSRARERGERETDRDLPRY